LNNVNINLLDNNFSPISPMNCDSTPNTEKTSDKVINNSNNNNRSTLQRMFGPLSSNSLRSGSLVLFQSAIGAGALALP